MWMDFAQKDALRYPFLLHGMLAYSALHLSSLDESTRDHYGRLSRYHMVQGVPEFRRTLRGLNDDSAGPCFAMALLLAGISMASISDNALYDTDGTRPPVTMDTLLSLFVLVQGVMGISGRTEWSALKQPSWIVGQLPYGINIRLHSTVDYETFLLPEQAAAEYDELRYQVRLLLLCNSSPSPFDFCGTNGGEHEDGDAETVCMDAIDKLVILHKEIIAYQDRRATHQQVTGTPGNEEFDQFFLVRWTVHSSPFYATLLRQRNQAALLILSRYADLIDMAEDSWCLKNWGRNAKFAIQEALRDAASQIIP